VIWFYDPMVAHGSAIGTDIENVPTMDVVGLLHALTRWLWP
jgi:hypothetical protein